MATVGEPRIETGQAYRLSGACMVVIAPDGRARIPGLAGGSSLPLGVAELLVLQAAARGGADSVDALVGGIAGLTGTTERALAAFVTELHDRGLLIERAEEQRTVPEPDAVGLSPSDQSSFPEVPEAPLEATTPSSARVTGDGFEMIDHEGRITARLSAAEVDVVTHFAAPSTPAEVRAAHRESAGPASLDDGQFEVFLRRLVAAVLLRTADPTRERWRGRELAEVGSQLRRRRDLLRHSDREREEHLAREADRRARTGVDRVPVVPMEVQPGLPSLALGMLVAYARMHESGALEDAYDLFPYWAAASRKLSRVTSEPSVFLFSNYVWTHTNNMRVAQQVKELSPESVVVFGGPETPKYPGDVEAFFGDHPFVDVAVRGEGEATFAEMLEALRGRIGDGPADLSPLEGVAGLTYRDGADLARTTDRERIADLDSIPSPYLTGVFDQFGAVSGNSAIIETNRGCPYSCTFCDWGSATLSRIRKFSLDRVFAELEWCARNEVSRVFVADANFGIFERDVEIAAKVAELKEEYGYPRAFGTNYAKNTVKHLRPIVETMARAGVITEGLLSLQTMDDDTLSTIKRTNIKVEKYDALAREFRSAGLPLFIDLMLGLPGSTSTSFRNDLQECVDRDVTAKIFPTEVLVNSPMNDPEYRARHGIEIAATGEGWYQNAKIIEGESHRRLVVATSTFTREDYEDMLRLRRAFVLFENFGLLRMVSRFVHQEAGVAEVAFYDRLRLDLEADRERWPVLAVALDVLPEYMIPPVSWRAFTDDVRDYVTTQVGVAADDSLDSVLAVQHATLPAAGRTFPCEVELAHDVVTWWHDILAAKDEGLRDGWVSTVARLRDYPRGSLVVEDPNEVSEYGLGFRCDTDYYSDWELRSPVARAMPARYRAGRN